MPIDAISSYQPTNTAGPTSKGGTLTMDDFFKLLVAQLSNQDIYNSVDDTQFIAQMAQFSMVQALGELSQASSTAYSVSLIGKEATVAWVGNDGVLQIHTGIVDSVTLYNGNPQLTIDGHRFDLSSVMEVREPNIIIPDDGLNDGPGDETEPPEGPGEPDDVTPPEGPGEPEPDEPGDEPEMNDAGGDENNG